MKAIERISLQDHEDDCSHGFILRIPHIRFE